MKALRWVFFVVALTAIMPRDVEAWDAAGHMLVGEIAWTQMTPAARERAAELVKTLDPRFHGGRPYNFITAGCWMDDMRSKKGYAWSKWHYVNIPFTPSGTECVLPEPPHVVWQSGKT